MPSSLKNSDLEEKIKIGTRGSKLALWQAHYLQTQLQEIGVESELLVIKTRGDQVQHLGFDKMEGKGFFTKEIEDHLLRGDIDLAVHSMKDLPTTPPEGLVITAVSYRENPADWLLIRSEGRDPNQLFQLKTGAVVGTSSARRKAQMLSYRPDVQLKDIRGNVPTRIGKLREGQFDAILLAAAGMSRLDISPEGLQLVPLNPKEFIPAPAQGVLAYQTHAEDFRLRRLLKKIHCPAVSAVTNVERRVLQLCGGGCHLPLGVYCELDTMGNYHVWAAKANRWEEPVKRVHVSSSTSFGLPEKVLQMLDVESSDMQQV